MLESDAVVVPRRTQAEVVAVHDSKAADQISFLTAISIDPKEDRARHEFGPEVEVEAVLRRHGGGQLMPAQPYQGFGVTVDYDVDLTHALRMVSEAKAEYAAAPADIRKRFPTFGQFVQAVESGAVAVREAEPTPTPPQRVIVVPEASSGDGAPSGAQSQPPK